MADYGRWSFLLLASALACSNPASEARRVLERFLDAHFHQRHEEAFGYLSDEDKSGVTAEQYVAGQKGNDSRNNLVKTSFKITSVSVNADSATAQVELTSQGLPGAMYAVAMKHLQEGDATGASALEDMFSEPHVFAQDFALKRENGQWRVFMNSKLAMEVSALRAKAFAHKKHKDWVSALDEQRKIIALHPGNVQESLARSEINRLEQKTYLKYLTLALVSQKQSLEAGKVDMEFELANSGDRVVDSLDFAFVAPADQPAIVSGTPDIRSKVVTVKGLARKTKERYKMTMPAAEGSLEILGFSLEQ